MLNIIDIPFPNFIPSTILGLLALLFWYIYNAYTNKNKTKLEEIKTVDQQDRTKIIEMMLNDLGVTLDTSSLSSEQKYNLLVRILNNKTRKYLIAAITLILLTGLVTFLIYNWQSQEKANTATNVSTVDKTDSIITQKTDTAKKTITQIAHSNVIKVGHSSDCNFSNLYDGVNYSRDGDTILLMEGQYDTVTIRKSIKIYGIGDKNKIRVLEFSVDGAPDIEIANVTTQRGLWITGNCVLTVRQCVIHGGVDMFSGYIDMSFTNVEGSSTAVFGIFLREGHGQPDPSAIISNCKIEHFSSGIATSRNTTINIDSSYISNNDIGIEVGAESTVTVKNTDLTGNRKMAIKNGGTFSGDKEILGTVIQENNQLEQGFGSK